LVWLWRSRQFEPSRIAFWLLLLIWLVLNNAQLSVARVDNDGSNALRDRYLIYGSLFWVSIVALGVPLIKTARYHSVRVAAFGGLVMILCLHVAASGSVLLSSQLEDFNTETREGLACLQAYSFRSPCVYYLETSGELLQMAIPYVYQYQPTFLNAADENPDFRYQFYLPAPGREVYHTIAGDSLPRTALEADTDKPLEWVYPIPPSSQLSFILGIWLAPETAESYEGAMFTISVTSDHPINTAPVGSTYQYFAAAGDAVRHVHIPVPPQTTSSEVNLRLSVQPVLKSGVPDDLSSLSAYWVRPRVTVQIIEFPQ
jgi:hypothetical protein